ncbi:MAG TPA: beta-ketoacyl synthase chain length factor [Rhodanobacteraceae bacterium]|nr:beta-ketoacyl synthase chain length factor [Rhodanobacteraceae bacterium]
MSAPLTVFVEGLGLWTPGLPDWERFAGVLRGDGAPLADMPARPAPACLASGERRRVPASVLIAIEAAAQAVGMSGRDPATLPSLFVSAHGDGPVLDYLCEVQARAPAETSPTRFHNSVHNAAAGYWTIATDCHESSCAGSALDCSFAAGLLEAASQVLAEARPVLLVAFDVAGTGPLGETISSKLPFACALVLAPAPSAATRARLGLSLAPGAQCTEARHPRAAELAAGNVAARAAPLLESLAGRGAADATLAAAEGLGLTIHTEIVA